MGTAEQAAGEGHAAHPVAVPAGVVRDTAANHHISTDPDALAVTALRTKSVHARELLAELAWPGRTQADVDTWVASRDRTLPPDADVFQLGQLARVLALQRPDEHDLVRSRALLEALVAAGTLDDLPQHAVQILLQLRGLDGDASGCAALLDHPAVPLQVAAGVRADLANPFLRTAATDAGEDRPVPAADQQTWLGLLDDALHSPDLAPLRLTPGRGATLFDQLHADPLPRADEPEEGRVTVVISSYRPGPPLLTAVRSLVEQTWHDLEILVVDDASGPEAEPWLRQAEAMDPRVRIIRKAVNGGTYRCRNTALRQARGRWFTTLDSDDWLHPEAIATLVRALESGPGLVAVRALGARVTEDLQVTKLGYRHRAVAAPTLLFRTSDVFSRLGFFDPARKSADTEYARRILLSYGRGSIRTIDECLLLLRSGSDTLSSSEFSRAWRHGARLAYKNLYARWHADIRAGGSPYLDPQTRPVVEPRRWTKGRDPQLPSPRHLDLVLGGDWRRYGGPQRSMIEEIRAAREAGLRVGILHLEALRFATVKDLPLCQPVLDLIRSGEVEWVQLDDDVELDVLMVRYPLVLQHPPHVGSGRALRPRHLLIMANQAPVEPDGTDQRYVVAEVTERARELFGVQPRWVPQGPVVREVLRAQDPDVELTDWDSPGLIDLSEWHVRSDRVPGEGGAPVVVGRYSRDDPMKFPRTLEEMLAAYTFGEGYAVRMMGAGRTWLHLAERAGLEQPTLPPGWELVRYRSIDPRELLADLDFMVYQDHPDRHEAFGRVLLEAAASGALVIAHPKHRRVFGEMLDYAEPDGVRELVEGYVADPDRYRRRVALTLRLVAEHYSHESFVRRLRRLPGVAKEWDARREREQDRGMPWAGEAVLRVAPSGTPHEPVRASVEVLTGGGLAVHRTPLRSAADAGRADHLVVVHAAGLSTATRDRLREALAVPAEAEVDGAVLAALAGSDDLTAVLLCRDGLVRLVPGPAVVADGPESWVLVERPREVRLAGGSTGSAQQRQQPIAERQRQRAGALGEVPDPWTRVSG